VLLDVRNPNWALAPSRWTSHEAKSRFAAAQGIGPKDRRPFTLSFGISLVLVLLSNFGRDPSRCLHALHRATNNSSKLYNEALKVD
jgi:hypothetical protein